MSNRRHTKQEVWRIGDEYGGELAAALLLVSSRGSADRAAKRQMAQIVLKQIEIAVQGLKNAAFPTDLIQIYERGVRAGVRERLLRSGPLPTRLHRAA